MDPVDKLLQDIVRREGGLADHDADRGGITNHGISLRYARRRGLDLNHDGQVDGADIKAVTPAEAVRLYREDFYEAPKIDRLPAPLQAFMTDFAVNSGPSRAVKELQKTLECCRQIAPSEIGTDPVSCDGLIGPSTVDAAERALGIMGDYLVNAVASARLDFLNALVADDPSQKVFLDGWRHRVQSFMIASPVT